MGITNMLLEKASTMGEGFLKRQVCSGNPDTIKKYAITALQAMPATAVVKLVQSSPICASGKPQESWFGGKRRKTRKQKRKQRKTRKH